MLNKKIKYYIILIGSIFLLWNIGAALTSPIFIPDPLTVFNSFIQMILNGQLLTAFVYSFIRITIASTISAVLAIFLGCLIRIYYPVNALLSPVVNIMRFLPVTAFYPMLTIWFGIGEEMKIAFLFVATFVYMLPSVILALNEVSKDVIEAASVEGANKEQLISRIILPIAAPSIAQSFAMMYGIGYTYIAVAEQTNAKYGIGYLIYTSSARGLTYMTFVGILTIIFIGILFDLIANKIIKKIFNWKFN